MSADDLTKVPRFERAPNDDNLKRDCMVLAQRVFDQWDGEVDCTMILTRRADKRPTAVYATTIATKERRNAVLKALLETDVVRLNGKDPSIP